MNMKQLLILFFLCPISLMHAMEHQDERLLEQAQTIMNKMSQKFKNIEGYVAELPEADFNPTKLANAAVQTEKPKLSNIEVQTEELSPREVPTEEQSPEGFLITVKYYAPIAGAGLAGSLITYLLFRKKIPIEIIKVMPVEVLREIPVGLVATFAKVGHLIGNFFKNINLTSEEIFQLSLLNNS